MEKVNAVCEICHKRPAIKTGSVGYECEHCASGVPDPFKHDTSRIGRNEPCYCGSGKKFKKCCLPKEMVPSKGKADEPEFEGVPGMGEG